MYGPGTLLAGRYRLDERLGGGGMGDVWRGTDQVLERTVAVKMMRRELVEEAGFAARFLAEARTMAAIKHPGVVGIHDYRGDAGEAFLVMEYISGEALSQRLQRLGRLPPADTMHLLAQAADALHAAHQKGVVHRDIKPGNLLVTDDDTVVLTDFGIARSAGASQLTATGAVVGTPSYLSPEQVLGQPATPQTDVYALGVVAYECLAGRRPFDGDNPFEIAMRRLREPPPTIAVEVPPTVLAVIEHTLAAEPEQRWQTAAELAAAARQAVDPRAGGTPAPASGGLGGTAGTPGGIAGTPGAGAVAAGAGTPGPARGTGDDPKFATARAPVRAASPPPPPTIHEPPPPSSPPVPAAPAPQPAPQPAPAPGPSPVPPASPVPPVWPEPRRPLAVWLGCLALLVSASGLALYFGGMLRVAEDLARVYEGFYTDISPAAADVAAASGPAGQVVAGTGLGIALILLLLTLPAFLGKRSARVWALLLGWVALCCCGAPITFESFGPGLGMTGLTPAERASLDAAVVNAMPDWYETLTGPVVLVSLGGLLVAVLLLSQRSAVRFYRRPLRPAYYYPQYPQHPYYYPYHGYPPRG